MEYLSTSSLAKEMDIPGKELFETLHGLGPITRNGDKWALTDAGRSKGRLNEKTGEYVFGFSKYKYIHNRKMPRPEVLLKDKNGVGRHSSTASHGERTAHNTKACR